MYERPMEITAGDGSADDLVMQDLGINIENDAVAGQVIEIDYEFIRMGGANGKVFGQILISGVEEL